MNTLRVYHFSLLFCAVLCLNFAPKGHAQNADPKLYKGLETPTIIRQDSKLRIGDDDTGLQTESGYSPFYHPKSVNPKPRNEPSVVVPSTPVIPPPEPKPIRETQIPQSQPIAAPPVRAPIHHSQPERPVIPAPQTNLIPSPPIDFRPPSVPITSTPETIEQPKFGFKRPTLPKAEPAVIARPVAPNRPVVRAIPLPQPRPEVYARPAQPKATFPTALPRPTQPRTTPPAENLQIPTLAELRNEAYLVGRKKIEYKFGRNHPSFGGLDSSGSIQYILHKIGMIGVPRTTGGQHSWVRVNNMLTEFEGRPSLTEISRSLVPGNLIFWGDQQSGKVSHVMLYLGFDPHRGHLAFGTRGGTEIGINHGEVDIFPLYLDREKIIATGTVPGLVVNSEI